MKKLTEKQKRFSDEYLVDLNATRAYKKAYPSVKKDETAAQAGSRLLRNVNVKEYIDKRIKDRQKRTEITQDKVLNELAAIAFSNGSKYAKVVERKAYDEEGKEVVDYETGKQLTYKTVEFKNTDDLTEDEKKAISSIHKGRDGMKVETYDKMKALELLGKHLGMFKDKLELSGTVNNPYEGLTTEQLLKLAGGNDG